MITGYIAEHGTVDFEKLMTVAIHGIQPKLKFRGFLNIVYLSVSAVYKGENEFNQVYVGTEPGPITTSIDGGEIGTKWFA